MEEVLSEIAQGEVESRIPWQVIAGLLWILGTNVIFLAFFDELLELLGLLTIYFSIASALFVILGLMTATAVAAILVIALKVLLEYSEVFLGLMWIVDLFFVFLCAGYVVWFGFAENAIHLYGYVFDQPLTEVAFLVQDPWSFIWHGVDVFLARPGASMIVLVIRVLSWNQHS